MIGLTETKATAGDTNSPPGTLPLPKKVLAVAYACNPYRGSEHGVGWGWLGMIAQSHQVHCIVGKDDKADIERFCRENPESDYARVNFVFVEHRWSRTLDRLFPPYYLWQFRRQWQREAYRAARRLHDEKQFDLCHLVTYVGYRIPGDFYKLDCPFVWGPIGGLENTPWRLLPAMGLKGAVYYGLRNVINSGQKRWLRAPKRAFEKAHTRGAVIAATPSIAREIERCYGASSTVICEVGPPPKSAVWQPRERREGESLRIAWSGLLLPGKALPLLLKGLADLEKPHDNWHLDVLGDGPCRAAWMRQAERLGLGDRVTWHGRVPRSDALATMRSTHLFVITSLKDLTSTVLLEALSLGLPVVCPDHCGFSNVVTDACGIKIGTESLKQMAIGYGRAVKALAQDEPERRRLSANAMQRAAAYSWDEKRRDLDALYCRVRKDTTFQCVPFADLQVLG